MHDTGRSVQISKELFLDLVKWHLLGNQEPDREERIRDSLQKKLDSAAARESYRRNLNHTP